MKKILDKRNMTKSDWDEYRAKQAGIGGSEVGAILGVNQWKTRFTLWLEKTGQKEHEQVDNEFVTWGNLLEPIIKKQFSEETGFKCFKNNFVLQHSEYDFMIANLDGEVIDPAFSGRGVLEVKTTSEWNRKEWEGEKVPLSYMAQMQHYLAVTGYEYGYLVVLIGGNKMRYWLVERDETLIELLIAEEKAFMNEIKNLTPPPIGGSKVESDWLAKQYPDALQEEMSIPQVIEEMASEYLEIQQEIKEKQARADEIKNKIKLEGKDFKMLKGYNVKIMMPTINKTLFDGKRFSAEHPDLYDEYKTKESSYRDFKVKLLEVK
jgi:putative phage-type endonuclease